MGRDFSSIPNAMLVAEFKRLIAECVKREQEYKSAWAYPAPMGDMAMDAYMAECDYEDRRGRPMAEDYLSEHPYFVEMRAEVKRRRLAHKFTNTERQIVIEAKRLLRLI